MPSHVGGGPLMKHFGTIDDCANALLAGAARYEAGIWRKRKSAVEFIFSFYFFCLFRLGAANSFEGLIAMSGP